MSYLDQLRNTYILYNLFKRLGVLGEGVWDDLRFPAAGINPPGQASDPDVDMANGTLLFAASGTEVVVMQAQMPHAWKEGSSISPHVHWYKTTSAAGDVMWRMGYKKAGRGEVMDEDFTLLTSSTSVITDDDTAGQHLITVFDDIDMSDMIISDMLIMYMARLGNHEDDTYGTDAGLLEFDIHYQLDSNGSRAEFIKT